VKVWIDTDPGIDDALALMLAVRSPELEVIGVSTVHGNIQVEQGAANALKILDLVGSSIPVWQGADRNLIGDLRTAPFIHGQDGLGELLPASRRQLEPGSAVQALTNALRQSDEPITIIAIAPLTNIALALGSAPDLAARIERLVIMGGAMRTEGNTTPAAEFNTFCDPEAARRVLTSGVPQVWVPLDVTMKTIMPAAWSAELARATDPVARFIGELTLFYSRYYRSYYGIDGCALHDPLTVASVFRPELLQTKGVFLDVELAGQLTRGRTVPDLWGIPKPHGVPNAQIALEVDAPAFLALFQERVLKQEFAHAS
jgi:inosine-uridine nucleoside N-ribohydrolase